MKKIVKLTDRPNACNNLTNFECEAHKKLGNGSDVNQLKIALKNS